MNASKKLARWSAGLLSALLLAPGPMVAAANAVDFAGQTVEWIVPFKPGGGTDRWARFYAPRLARHLPGQPNVVVKNIPGGGSTTGANQFARRAKPDGLSLLGSSTSTLFPFLLGDRRVQYDYADWRVALVSPAGGVAYVRPDLAGPAGPGDLSVLADHPLVFASQGATSLDLIMLLALELLGLEPRAVFGMKGRAAARLAFERGEANIDYQTTPAYLRHVVPLLERGKAAPLFSWGTLDAAGTIVRDPTFPELPHFAEVYRAGGGDPAGPAFAAWRALFAAGYPAQKMLLLPKDTPPDIVAAYHRAFADIFAADEFPAAAARALGSYRQFTGAEAAAMKNIAAAMDPEAREWARKWLREKHGAQL